MLEQKMNEQIITAMKDGDKVTISTLRMAVSEIKNKKIEDRVKELSDEKVISVLQKMVKKYKESIDQFQKGNRQDLVDKETEEMEVLLKFLPEAMSSEEMERLVCEAIVQTGASAIKDMGKVMGLVLSLSKGRADGKTVSELVKQKLSK